MRTETMRMTERGFTFIEILVVMGIIAVLAGLTVGAIAILNERQPAIKTEARVQKVAATINQWYQQFERYPPTDPAQLRKIAGGSESLPGMENSINVGIETLFQALYWPSFQGDPSLAGGGEDLEGGEISNTDEDEFDRPSSQGTNVYEIKDDWGNPLIYFVHTDYARADANPPTYQIGPDTENAGDEVEVRPWKYDDEARGFAEAQGFQLFSMGPDGLPNTPDDIKAWKQ